ncbi:MAG TPA: hypothetical protein DC049_15520, partial [Spirochaetia bacterium]|nr:hypothetical protein [Spirochaetia bacterium]
MSDGLGQQIFLAGKAEVKLDSFGNGETRVALPALERNFYRIDASINEDQAFRYYCAIKDLTTVKKSSCFFGGSIENSELYRDYYLSP